MALGTTLENLVVMFRAETRQSLSAAQGLNTLDAAKMSLRRVQEQLYDDFDWPHLRVRRDEALQAGQSVYSFPADLNADRVETAVVKGPAPADRWVPVKYGITPAEYNQYDSEADVRADPVRRWALYEGGQYEVWPRPATTGGVFRLEGISALPALTDDQHVAVLDDLMIVMFAAAEWLEANKSPAAKSKLAAAQARYNRLRGNSRREAVSLLHRAKDRAQAPAGVVVRAPGT